MTLGVIFHSALIFIPDTKWRASFSDGSIAFSYLTTFIHDFRMYAFYIIAGFFFFLVYEKYGSFITIKRRVARLAIPMVFIGLTFNHFMNQLSQNRDHSVDFYTYILAGEWLAHLWFIGNLIIYYLLSIIFVSLLANQSPIKINKVILSALLIIGVPFFTVVLDFICKYTYSETILFVSFRNLFHYLPYYLLGIYFYKYKDIFFFITQIKVASIFLVISVILVQLSNYFNVIEISYSANQMVEYTYRLSLSLFIMGIFNKIAVENKFTTKIVDSSYTIYLLHLPVIIFIFPLVSIFSFDVLTSFLFMSVLTFTICYLFHEHIVRKHRILMYLFNGIYQSKIAK